MHKHEYYTRPCLVGSHSLSFLPRRLVLCLVALPLLTSPLAQDPQAEPIPDSCPPFHRPRPTPLVQARTYPTLPPTSRLVLPIAYQPSTPFWTLSIIINIFYFLFGHTFPIFVIPLYGVINLTIALVCHSITLLCMYNCTIFNQLTVLLCFVTEIRIACLLILAYQSVKQILVR